MLQVLSVGENVGGEMASVGLGSTVSAPFISLPCSGMLQVLKLRSLLTQTQSYQYQWFSFESLD